MANENFKFNREWTVVFREVNILRSLISGVKYCSYKKKIQYYIFRLGERKHSQSKYMRKSAKSRNTPIYSRIAHNLRSDHIFRFRFLSPPLSLSFKFLDSDMHITIWEFARGR